jgi:hypothetical protein
VGGGEGSHPETFGCHPDRSEGSRINLSRVIRSTRFAFLVCAIAAVAHASPSPPLGITNVTVIDTTGAAILIRTPEEGRRAVAMLAGRGVDFIKIQSLCRATPTSRSRGSATGGRSRSDDRSRSTGYGTRRPSTQPLGPANPFSQPWARRAIGFMTPSAARSAVRKLDRPASGPPSEGDGPAQSPGRPRPI